MICKEEHLEEWMVKETILSQWDIGDIKSIENIDSFKNTVYLIQTTDLKKYVLKKQKASEKIHREVALLFSLGKTLPIASPILTIDKTYYYPYDEKFYVLYPFLQGQSFKDHFGERAFEQAELLSLSIGDLHLLLKDIDLEAYKDFNLLDQVSHWSKEVLHKYQENFDYDFIVKVMKVFEREFAPLYEDLPKHMIHRDFHPGNVLFEDDKLSGILDFELTVRGIRIFDPCYLATSMLVACIDHETKCHQWPSIFQKILETYNEINPLSREERESIIYLLYAIQFIFMAYFCTTDNFEAAKCNEKVLKWLFDNQASIEDISKKLR